MKTEVEPTDAAVGTLERPRPQALVIFGASGDLTRRKIIPALYGLACEGLLPEHLAIVGYARREFTDAEFRTVARSGIEEFTDLPLDDEHWGPFEQTLSYIAGAFDTKDCMGHLAGHLARVDDERGTAGGRLYYCATPPSAFPLIVQRLGEIGPGRGARIVIEKPFGRDLASAIELNTVVREVFSERDVFRIDHYLGKETVQNLLVLRFANSMFERVWNRDAIDHVQITVAEEVGVEGRGRFYEEAGAMRDMVQNHLLQMVAFLAMEPPRSLEPEAIRDEKAKLLQAVRPFEQQDVVRGQYANGVIDGKAVPGYGEEAGVPPGTGVETFCAIRMWVDNWRWHGVPFFLRTGKRLPRRATDVTVVFRDAPGYLFDWASMPSPNHFSIRIQPEEGISFDFHAKQPGPGFVPRKVRMDFWYAQHFGARQADAYERLLYDAMIGDNTLFNREDAVERAWAIVAPVLQDQADVHPYLAGTWGPRAADDLIAPRRWHVRT